MPAGLGRALTAPLGPLMYRMMKRRRRIAERNIERCFPELDAVARDRLVRAGFTSLARAIAEMAWSWSGSDRLIERLGEVDGLEHIQAALQRGKGVLMVTSHSMAL